MAHEHASAEDEYLATPPGAGHEHTDANVGVIVKFGVWLLVSAVVVHIGMYLMFVLFVEQREEPVATQPFPIAVGQEPRLPAAPRLQAIPVNEYYQFRLQEQQELDNYGWVDRAGGKVRIPISEAMRLIVERGVPPTATPGAPAATPAADAAPPAAATPSPAVRPDPALIPADSSSGRTMERRR